MNRKKEEGKKMLLKEFCAENFTLIPAALANGANRIELCDNLTVGGTTVSCGVMEETIRYCHELNVPVMAIIRPRGGDFCYHDIEVNIMETDIIEAKKMGIDGVVIGALTEDGLLDTETLERLLDVAEGLQVTFHMAFDAIAPEQQFAAMDWLIEHGVQRILTHGGPSGTPIADNIPKLKELIAYANNRITILPGGNITADNAERIAQELDVQEVHGTKIVSTSLN